MFKDLMGASLGHHLTSFEDSKPMNIKNQVNFATICSKSMWKVWKRINENRYSPWIFGGKKKY